MLELPDCHFIVDATPNSGAWNMALDEVLLDEAVSSHLCAARVYEWAEATLSLGYFQASTTLVHPSLATLSTVRRLSGGGAILHHRELTYSCVVPPTHPFAAEPMRIYDSVHAAIIDLLAAWGIRSSLRGAAEPGKDSAFLCFSRGDQRDIVFAGQKIVGSAQRRRKGAVLQHGSVLLRRSEFAPEFSGALDLVPDARLPENPNFELAQAVAGAIGRPVLIDSLNDAFRKRAEILEATRYYKTDWEAGPT
jgi:lipoate-protein ligase A